MSSELAVQNQTPSVGGMLQAFIDRGITAENVSAFEQLCALHERMEAKSAERLFSEALAAFQEEMPVLVAQTEIKNRGSYERYEDILHVARPLLIKNGFSVRFTQTCSDGRILATCTLRHRAGHSEKTEFAVRLGGRGDSDTQVDCKASTTAKRYAFCFALNIIIRQSALDSEDDAKLLGAPIDELGAEILESRAEEVGANIAAFLKMFGVDSFKDFPLARLKEAHDKLDAKERKNREAR